MSGGYWNYVGYRIRDELLNIAQDKNVASRWPKTAEALAGFADAIYKIEHGMDWDLSADASIRNDTAFDNEAVGLLLEAVLKAAPDAWFPRGKWATIQAVQARRG
jgi:hypothetical protein